MAEQLIRDQQKEFIDEYLKLRKKNATQAAINAGYREKSAASQASQLLKVVEYLKKREQVISKELREESSEVTEIKADGSKKEFDGFQVGDFFKFDVVHLVVRSNEIFAKVELEVHLLSFPPHYPMWWFFCALH